MKKNKFLSAVTAIAMTFCMSGSLLNTIAEEESQKLRVMPLGDSITDGFNVVGGCRVSLWKTLEENGYTENLDFVGPNWGGDGIDPNHAGYSGYSIADIPNQRSGIYNFIDWLMTEYPADVVMLQIGTNDILSSYELDGMGERLELLVDSVLNYIPENGMLFLATIPYMDADVTYYTDAYTAEEMDKAVDDYNAQVKALAEKKIAEGKPVTLSDNNAVLTKADLADGVHPSEEGYAKLGAHWYSMLKPFLDGTSENPEIQPTEETTEETTEFVAPTEETTEATEPQPIPTEMETACIEPVPYDLDFDGRVGVSDIVVLQKYLLKKSSLPAWTNADLNGDRVINVIDLALLKRFVFNQA